MVSPTRVVTLHRKALEVMITSGLGTTPHGYEAGAVVVLVVEALGGGLVVELVVGVVPGAPRTPTMAAPRESTTSAPSTMKGSMRRTTRAVYGGSPRLQVGVPV